MPEPLPARRRISSGVIVAADKFKGSLTALQVAEADDWLVVPGTTT
jgi:hypothetical protein